MMVTPEAWSARTTSHMPLRSSTSTPAVGSSRKRICGSCDSALAIITRRFMPPDRVMSLLSLRSKSDSDFMIYAGRAVLRLFDLKSSLSKSYFTVGLHVAFGDTHVGRVV